MRKYNPHILAVISAFCMTLSLPNESQAASCFQTVWAPSNKYVAQQYWDKVRADYETKAPGSANGVNIDAVSFVQYPKGNRTYLSGHKSPNPEYPNYINEWRPTETWFKTNVARASVDIFIPNGFASKGGRLAFGIRGGADPAGCLSGGCPPEKQTAFSVRVQYYSGSTKGNLYSYHLNRHPSASSDVKAYGQGTDYSGSIPVGQWVTLWMEVNMGDPGKSNGSTLFRVIDRSGKVVNEAKFENVMYRKNASWDRMGVIMTEKMNPSGAWGIAAPQKQKVYYRNWKMQIPCN